METRARLPYTRVCLFRGRGVEIMSKMKWALALALLSAVVSAEVVDRVVAVVGDEVITELELNQAYTTDSLGLMQSGPLAGGTSAALTREDYLDRMIEKKVIDLEVKRQGISVDALEVEQAIDRKRESLNLTPEQFERALKREGLTMEVYRKQVKDQLITYRLISREVKGEIEISEDEIQAFYKQHPEQFMNRNSYHLYHIFLAFPEKSGPQGEADTVAKMEQIRKSISDGADFEDMARKYSMSPTASKGGDLGWFALSELLPAFQEQTQLLGLGEMSPVFVHEAGAHLLLLKDIKGGDQLQYDQVKDQIRDVLFQKKALERYDLWLKRLKAKTYIENRLQGE
jgi:peptidyl-prolyl cis-trans isomerase SurA